MEYRGCLHGRSPDGERVVDFRAHNLHIVSYSEPLDRTLTLEEIRPHLHSLPGRPDWIPYRTSYYRRDWGFCMSDRKLQSLRPGRYQVRVDSSLAPGSLSYAECVLPGKASRKSSSSPTCAIHRWQTTTPAVWR
jgi:aminopeptidase-like protein